jgi:CHAT domain-containing protein
VPAADLYQVLINELLRTERLVTHVWVLPDEILAGVPFTALWDDETQQPLIARTTVAIAPSAGLLVRRLSGVATRDRQPRALAVGASSADGRLPSLPAADAEATEVASMFPGAQLLVGPQATRQVVLARLRHVNVVHFAGHALANFEYPHLSRLVLRSDDGQVEGLTIADIVDSDADLDLVVLSACRTAEGPAVGGEGALSLARAFASAGGPVVLATSWDVGDAAASSWVRSFYAEVRSKHAPALAAAVASRRMISDGAGPRDWGAWMVSY